MWPMGIGYGCDVIIDVRRAPYIQGLRQEARDREEAPFMKLVVGRENMIDSNKDHAKCKHIILKKNNILSIETSGATH